MRHSSTVLSLLLLCILLTSCRKDFEFEASTGNLEFSKDTVYLDTVFTNIGSSTYNLKVFNRSNKDIRIPVVRLANGTDSNYRLNVDGRAGKEFQDVEILAKDSIFIFVETTLDIAQLSNSNEFLYTDVIQFDSGSNLQKVALVTLVKDAIFLYPDKVNGIKETLLLGTDENNDEIRIEGFFLEDDELTFTNEKPYVIYGYAAVGNGKTMTVDAGARLHFHADSGLLIDDGASLVVNGALSIDESALENEVIFEGDRLEPSFSDIPGQWGTVWFSEGSTGNSLNYLTVKNAIVGLFADGNDGTNTPTLQIKNTQIQNASNMALLARNAYLEAENTVIGNAGELSLYCTLGGNYTFRHCTVANYWSRSFRNNPAVVVSNYLETSEGNISNDLEFNFSNGIIYGVNNLEFFLDKNSEAGFNFSFTNSLLKFNDTTNEFGDDPLFDFENASLYTSIILNEDPIFKDVEKHQFMIGNTSPAINKADLTTAQLVPLDLRGVNRTSAPDMGAYQNIDLSGN